MEKLSDKIASFISMIEKCNNTFYKDYNMSTEFLKKQNDYIHKLEFEDLTYHQIAHLGLDLRKLRRNRRGYKNEYILYEPVVNFLKDNPDFIDKLNILIDEVKKVEFHLDNQHYNIRSSVDGIENVSKDKDSTENILKENIVSLNTIFDRIFEKYEINDIFKDNPSLDKILSHESERITEIDASLYAKCPPSYGSLKDYMKWLRSDIEKFFYNDLKNKRVEISISDYLIKDDIGSKLCAYIDIYDSNNHIYRISCRCYATEQFKSNQSGKKKKNKRKTKSKR